MISRNLFIKLIKQDIKKRIWCPILIFVMCFLALEVRMLMELEEIVRYPHLYSYGIIVYIREYFFGQNAVNMSIIACIAAFLCGLSGYAYLHSKVQLDLYHSLPVSRSQFFWARYLSGILQFSVPFVLNVAVCIGIAASRKAVTAEMIPAVLSFIGIQTIIFVLVYSVTVIATGLTGNLIVSILGTGVLFVYSTGLELLTFWMSEHFFDTYVYNYKYEGNFVCGSSIWFFSPLSMITKFFSRPVIMTMSDANKLFKYNTSYIGVLIVAAVLYSLAAYIIFMKRASESAGKPIAFRIAEPVIKTMVVIPLAFFSGFFFCMISYNTSSEEWFLFGVIFGFIVICILMEIIYRMSLRGAMMHKKQFLFNAACTALIFVIFRYDVTGYDTYVPADAQIQSCAVSISELMPLSQNIQVSEFSTHRLGATEYRMANMELKGNPSVMTLARKAAKEQLKYHYFDYYEGIENSSEYIEITERQKQYHWIEYGFKLSNGKTIYRKYMIDVADADTIDLLSDIFNDYDYKIGSTPIFNDGWNIDFDFVRCESNFKIADIALTPQIQSKLIETYQKEYTKLTLDMVMHTVPTGTIDFVINSENNEDLYTSYSGEMLVYPQFSETIALIKDYGFDMLEHPTAEDVELVRVRSINDDPYAYGHFNHSPYRGAYSGINNTYDIQEDKTVEYEYTDKEQIQQILDSVVSGGFSWNIRQYADLFDDRYIVDIQLEKRDRNNSSSYKQFIKGKLPAFIQ